MLNACVVRARRLIAGAALAAAIALPILTPKPAEAWWGPGLRGGVVIGVPAFGVPIYPPAPYPTYYYPYAPAYTAVPPYWHWVPEFRAANGHIVAGHWEH